MSDFIDPFDFQKKIFPGMVFADYQKEIIESVRDNFETVCPAGNGLGKDYIASFIAVWWMCSRRPARVVTTSASSKQLERVLWGEIRKLLGTSEVPLCLHYNHMHIRQTHNNGEYVHLAECIGQTVSQGEALQGMHLPKEDGPHTCLILDEASAISDSTYIPAITWAHRILIIGNPLPCANFFYRAVKEGDTRSLMEDNWRRKVIHIRAEDSPNVKEAFREMRAGTRRPEPCLIKSDKNLSGIFSRKEFTRLDLKWKLAKKVNPPEPMPIPGMISINDYVERRTTWNDVQQSISLDGKFYEGSEVLLCPPKWLELSADYAASIAGSNQHAVTLGVDPAEGGDNTVLCVCSKQMVLELVSRKTPDTSDIPKETMAMMLKYRLRAEDVYFDAGGGGKQIADMLRDQYGHKVNTVRFGGAATANPTRGMKTLDRRLGEQETQFIYKNKRAEMYGILRERLNPTVGEPFGIPREETELRRQLAPLPLLYDEAGRMWLPPKDKKNKESTVLTLKEMLGCSPDEADSLVLALYGQRKSGHRVVASLG